MLTKTAIDRLIPILRKDCRRALRMRVEGFPRPYFCAFLLRDIEWFNTWASSGSTYRKRADHTRNVNADIRVGSYRYDQTTHGGLRDNDEDRDSVAHITVPIDDRNYDGLRLALWRLSETKFREALSDFSQKEANRISTVDANRQYLSFARAKKSTSIQYAKPEPIDEERWTLFCKNISAWMAELPHVSTNWVEFDASHESKLLVNTEGSVIVQHSQIYSLMATISKLTKEGAIIEQEVVINCASQKELPSVREFKAMIREKYEKLIRLMRAKPIHSFAGPVLLYPGPAGLLFHEALGHRLEGCRLLSTGEGQTFRGQVGKRILNVNVTVRDNPRMKAFGGKRCIGAYDYDDEGTPSKNALLIENGILKGFLSSRAAFLEKNFASNGHARTAKFQRAMSRMGVTVIEGRQALSLAQLKELLIEEINEQGKPFGMIVYETSGGETETTAYDFQTFAGNISYATLVYPDGREVVTRGVNFVGTPLQALNNVVAVGDTLELDNSYCGAESGMVPVSTIAPAVLLSELELQAKEEELRTQFILPRPNL